MNPSPDYSCAYVILGTDAADGLEGHGFTFTNGRGTEIQRAAIDAFRPLVVGLDVEAVWSNLGAFWRHLVGEAQLRWLGPEKGVVHMAVAAIVNAVWDLAAKKANKPLWRLLVDMEPEQVVDLVDFRYLTDVLTREEAIALLEQRREGREARIETLLDRGIPAYTTSPGWLGYSDEKLRRLSREAVADGFELIKLKVGGSIEDDLRRCRAAREEIGPDVGLAIDANQVWSVDEAIDNLRELEQFALRWIEEPTSPDDILGHAAIARAFPQIPVATGEHAHNRVMFKQLLASNAIQVCQVDACRLGGLNEVIAVVLMAAKLGVPVCPHGGGVGLCELVQHVSAFDYVAVGGTWDGRVVEFVDHLHEHFVDPAVVERGRYVTPARPGYSSEMHRESLAEFSFPDGSFWQGAEVLSPSDAIPSLNNFVAQAAT
jgi:L-fuconate dehydratase